MKARPAGRIAAIEASWSRPEAKAAWEERVRKSRVREGPHWTTIDLTEAEGRRVLEGRAGPADNGALWIVDAKGCVVRANAGHAIIREVLSSLLAEPEPCGDTR